LPSVSKQDILYLFHKTTESPRYPSGIRMTAGRNPRSGKERDFILFFMKQISTFVLMCLASCSFAQNWLTKPITPFVGVNARADLLAAPQQNVIWSTAADTSNYSGGSKQVARSIDGGNTWTSINNNAASASQRPSALFAINQDIAFLAMADFVNLGGGLYRTTNGGSTWVKATGVYDDAASFPDVVAFFDAQNGVTLGDPLSNGKFEIYTTADGGNTWTALPASSCPNAQTNEYGSFQTYAVIGNTIWAGTSQGRILKSADKGMTWSIITTPNTSFVDYMAVKNDNEMWISVEDGSANSEGTMKTMDGGVTWNWTSALGATIQGVRGVHVSFVKGSNDTYILGGARVTPGVLISTDGASTFTKIDNFGLSAPSVWLNPQTGYAHSNYSTGVLQPSLLVWNNGTVANDKPLVYECTSLP
jgi:photosystem II stability/assembly factor-like uncharacterized protein